MATQIDLPKFTLDFEQRLFIAKAGVTAIDVAVDMYSDWKEGILANDEGGQALAMRAVGGDEIDASTGQSLGSTYFLLNGYRIRPQEADHTLSISGNIFTDPSTNAIFTPTIGAFTVSLVFTVSNLVDASVARLDLDQLLQAIFIDTVGGETGTGENLGTPTRPVNNIADARALADSKNLRKYVLVRGSITLDQDHNDWIFESHETGNAVALNGFSVNGAHFERIGLSGAGSGEISVETCLIGSLSGVDAVVLNSRVDGTITMPAGGSLFLKDSADALVGPTTPTIVMSPGGGDFQARRWNGGLLIQGMTEAGHSAVVEVNPGRLLLDSSNTGGDIIVRGIGFFDDQSAGTAVTDQFLDSTEVQVSNKIVRNRMETDPATGVLTVYDDDGVTPLVTGNIFEDVAGAVPYQDSSTKINRRNRLA